MIMFNTSSAVAVASLRAFVTCRSTLSAPRRVVTCFGLSILGTKMDQAPGPKQRQCL